MQLHANAALSLTQRRRMARRIVDEGWSLREAAEAAEVSDRTAQKWAARYRAGGELGLLDHSSAPACIPHRTAEDRVQAIAALRRLRMTAAEIAMCLAMPLSTVSAVLLRIGLGKLSRLEPPEPANRYERRHAGELLHVDINRLGRIRGAGHRVTGHRASQKRIRVNGKLTGVAGWEFVHVCVDDATRLAYVEVLEDETAKSAVAFLRRAIAFYAAHGIKVQSVMSDNGSCYRSTPSLAVRCGCATSAPAHTDHRPTGRLRGSSEPSSAAGPTERSMAAAKNAQPPLTAGYGSITIDDHTAPSATSRPSLDSTS